LDLKQQGKEKQQSTVTDSGFITEEVEVEIENEEEKAEAGAEEPAAEQMQLKNNVDSVIQQWTVESSLASGSGINNLNSTTTDNIITTNTKKNAPQNSSKNSGTTTTDTFKNINIMNAWEQFYQQNDDGDT